MKWIFLCLGLAAMTLAAVGAGSCAINHKSGEFECGDGSPCSPGRVCVDGFCVTTTTPTPDARPPDGPKPDANVCPAQCTQCAEGGICIIDCAAGANCTAPVVCPQGFDCVIRCNLQGSCRAGIDCTAGDSCDIQCTGRGSCRDTVCGPGPCKVSCTGQNSCDTVLCGASCACDVTCSFNGSCTGVQCTGLACDTGLGCSSNRPGCDTCP